MLSCITSNGLNVLFSISLHKCHRSSRYVTNQQIHINKIYLILSYITIYRHVSVASATIFRVSNKNTNKAKELLYLYRARNTITRLSIPTHAQLQRHRLKFIKNHLKKLLHVSVYDHLQGVTMSSLKSLLFDHSWMYAKRGDVAAFRVVCIVLYKKSVRVYVF